MFIGFVGLAGIGIIMDFGLFALGVVLDMDVSSGLGRERSLVEDDWIFCSSFVR